MTDLQDQILDKLVGLPISADWPCGPLATAAGVIGGKKEIRFGVTDSDRGAKSEIARRLGYPILLCEAIQGGTRGLRGEEDRRSFAMSLFSTIPIESGPKRLPILTQARVAVRVVIRAHRYLCFDAICPVVAILQQLEECEERDWMKITRGMPSAVCPVYKRPVNKVWGMDIRVATNMERTISAAERLCPANRFPAGADAWSSARESARAVASAKGVGEAVACCVEIARGCGMKV